MSDESGRAPLMSEEPQENQESIPGKLLIKADLVAQEGNITEEEEFLKQTYEAAKKELIDQASNLVDISPRTKETREGAYKQTKEGAYRHGRLASKFTIKKAPHIYNVGFTSVYGNRRIQHFGHISKETIDGDKRRVISISF